jgi:hypothetical protein
VDNLLETAIRLAAKVHKGQVDRFSKPYILHVMRVMMRGHDFEEQVLGALHDVLERSAITVDDLAKKGFPPRILKSLEHISRHPEETYEQYIDRVMQDNLAVRVKLQSVAREAAGAGYEVHIKGVRMRLLQGSITIEGMDLVPDSSLMDSVRLGQRSGLVQVEARALHLSGLSYAALFRHGHMRLQRIALHSPVIMHFYASGLTGPDTATGRVTGPGPELPSLIAMDTLVISDARGATTDLSGLRASVRVEHVDIQAGGLGLTRTDDGQLLPVLGSAFLAARGMSVELPPLYDLHMDALDLHHPSGTAEALGLALVPRADEHSYGKLIPFETDLVRLEVDTLRATALDVGGFLGTGSYRLERLEVVAPRMDVFRDKTLPDPPFIHKPLPTGMLSSLKASLAADTLEIVRGRIHYHERDSLSPDYGTLAFGALQARLTGVDNRPAFAEAGGSLRVHATARVYDNSTVRMDLTAPWDASDHSFAVSAYLNSIPFEVFNRMTDSLLRVEATAGRIHTLVMHMHGNDRGGKGTVDMEYEDLRISVHRSGKADVKDKLLGAIANTLVRSRNLKDRGRYRQGEFSIDRRRDRGIFNFLWSGLKAGCLDTVVPGILRERVRDATQRKEAAR